MKLGSVKAQLPWSLEHTDMAFCHAGGLGWNAREALLPLGAKATVADNIEELALQVMAAVRPGDHIVCMSNGGFGGIHQKLLAGLQHWQEPLAPAFASLSASAVASASVAGTDAAVSTSQPISASVAVSTAMAPSSSAPISASAA
jgi:hypothetical protein